MLPRSQRLSVEQFNLVMEKGRITHSPLFIMRSMPMGADGQARVSAVAPQKTFKKAVERTRLRRQIYEAVKPLHQHIKAGALVVLLAKEAAAKSGFVDLKKETRAVFVKAGLLK